MMGINKLVVLSSAFILLAGCASGPRTHFSPTANYKFTKSIVPDAVIKISKVTITGDLKGSAAGYMPQLVAGFEKNNRTVRLVANSENFPYFDSELVLDISTKASLSTSEYIKAVPIVSAFSFFYGSGGLEFKWNAIANYLFNSIEGKAIYKGSFAI